MTYPISPLAEQIINQVRTAPPGSAFTVRVPVGTGHTQTMFFALAGASRPLLITRMTPFAVRCLERLRDDVDPELLPAFVRILHVNSVTFDVLDAYAPDRIVIDNPPVRGGSRWKTALTESPAHASGHG